MKRIYKISVLTAALFLALSINLFSDITAYAEVGFENNTDQSLSNDLPTLIECPPPPGQGGNYPSTSSPLVEVGETFTIDDHVTIFGPPADIDVIAIEPESLIEAVNESQNKYRALAPGQVKISLSYYGQYNCSEGRDVSFSGSLQLNVTIPGPPIVMIYFPVVYK